jgi:hypothetical protein
MGVGVLTRPGVIETEIRLEARRVAAESTLGEELRPCYLRYAVRIGMA